MGIASLGGILSGAGDVSTASPKWTQKAFQGLLGAYTSGLPSILGAEQTYKGQYNALNMANLGTSAGTLQNLISGLLPKTADMVRGANPGQTGLLDTLTNSAQQQLNAGAALDPALARVTEQSIRGGQAARGLGYGPADVLQESSALTSLGNQLRNERQNFAGNVAQMDNAMVTQPALSLAQSIPGTASALNATSGASIVPTSLSGSLLTMPYQAKLTANQATAANNTSLYQSMDSNQSSMISSL